MVVHNYVLSLVTVAAKFSRKAPALSTYLMVGTVLERHDVPK